MMQKLTRDQINNIKISNVYSYGCNCACTKNKNSTKPNTYLTQIFKVSILVALIFIQYGCKKDNIVVLNSEKQITSFVFTTTNNAALSEDVNEPWFSLEISKFMPLLIVGLPVLLLGVVGGSLSEKYFKRYFASMLAVALTVSVGALIFGLVAKFSGQPSFVFSGFLMGGGIATVIIIGLWYVIYRA